MTNTRTTGAVVPHGPADVPDAYDQDPAIIPLLWPQPVATPSMEAEVRAHDVIYIRERQCLQRVQRSSIRILSADANHVMIHAMERRFVLRNSLREVMQQLDDKRFVQVNRQTAINIEHLVRVDRDSLEVDSVCITLSRNFRNALLDRLQVLSER